MCASCSGVVRLRSTCCGGSPGASSSSSGSCSPGSSSTGQRGQRGPGGQGGGGSGAQGVRAEGAVGPRGSGLRGQQGPRGQDRGAAGPSGSGEGLQDPKVWGEGKGQVGRRGGQKDLRAGQRGPFRGRGAWVPQSSRAKAERQRGRNQGQLQI